MCSAVLALDSDQPLDAADQQYGDFAIRRQEDFFDETVEFSNNYGPGKLHPVQFGDLFKDMRYKVLRKLGSGSFSTVWLAKDRSLDKYVALKIATAKSSATEHESTILAHLSRQQHQHPGQVHITMLLDSFEHRGPNGLHRCLIFDVMGPSSSTMFNYLPSNWRSRSKTGEQPGNGAGRPAFWVAKSVLRQVLLGIDFLHKNRVVHGDLQPGNFLFSMKDLSSFRESDLAEVDSCGDWFVKKVNEKGEVDFQHLTTVEKDADADADVYTQRQVNGKPDPSAPRYIVDKEPMFEYVHVEPPLLVQISDLGGAFFISEPPARPVTPLGLRSPELVLGQTIGEAQDIWSFGCLMFEFLTGRALFSLLPPIHGKRNKETFSKDDDMRARDASVGNKEHAETTNDDHLVSYNDTCKDKDQNKDRSYVEKDKLAIGMNDDTNDDHVLQMAYRLGPLPSSFLANFPRSHFYFDDKGNITKDHVGHLTEEDGINYVPVKSPIETLLDQTKGADMDSRNTIMVKELLRLILRFYPVERPTAEMLLAHPWFMEPDTVV